MIEDKIKISGSFRLTPNKRGVFKVGKRINLEKIIKESVEEWHTFVETGTIKKIKRVKGGLIVIAVFPPKEKYRIPQKKLLKFLFKGSGLYKKNLEILFKNMLSATFSPKELKRILKNGAIFETPKFFKKSKSWLGELLYLKIGKKYYRV